nr:hypothetical protein HmN_000437400 [Hymenolepis microstoma]
MDKLHIVDPSVWPPNTPVRNPMDYYLCREPHKSPCQFYKDKALSETLLKKSAQSPCSRFWDRFKAVIFVNSSDFE